ncbi:hypothetical protein GUJ93_ZPchr0006g44139 [Zizania palustris]|uniref:Uncharacterized protein n=1 Tax=Zizania palustris TaxID=103762 RepID=A0A8J5T1Q9_ZIZPA|nr:hypothetical protein GUJ93_ZPchr0006g44139 [Zizania palustris]
MATEEHGKPLALKASTLAPQPSSRHTAGDLAAGAAVLFSCGRRALQHRWRATLPCGTHRRSTQQSAEQQSSRGTFPHGGFDRSNKRCAAVALARRNSDELAGEGFLGVGPATRGSRLAFHGKKAVAVRVRRCRLERKSEAAAGWPHGLGNRGARQAPGVESINVGPTTSSRRTPGDLAAGAAVFFLRATCAAALVARSSPMWDPPAFNAAISRATIFTRHVSPRRL